MLKFFVILFCFNSVSFAEQVSISTRNGREVSCQVTGSFVPTFLNSCTPKPCGSGYEAKLYVYNWSYVVSDNVKIDNKYIEQYGKDLKIDCKASSSTVETNLTSGARRRGR